jgi:hypothetical protein
VPHSTLDLISEQQTVVATAITELWEQIGKLTNDLHTAEIELSDRLPIYDCKSGPAQQFHLG